MNTRTVICAIAATLAAGSLLAAASALAASALVDSPSSGVVGEGPGVGPGWIARRRRRLGVWGATGQPTHPFGLPVYNFIDSQLPA
jgi:hypothetical protein